MRKIERVVIYIPVRPQGPELIRGLISVLSQKDIPYQETSVVTIEYPEELVYATIVFDDGGRIRIREMLFSWLEELIDENLKTIYDGGVDWLVELWNAHLQFVTTGQVEFQDEESRLLQEGPPPF